ncbi:sigma-54-dependent Fis family transcriptional regulator [Clostridium fallax]|uniref:Transcriptional regulator of acetoin/glycerol metabolism n=1 Tax=Clostridium fallax TaxID=1533 RepID=A0A1M4SFE1_9CLOT|nr:sigma 54-interacting transcriptional regulator [Clostridium fallax]SHE30901.1 Transcriptional regulator of acetoin/glycerol metabolism [Clostridium fallax]SQB07807.1 Fis family GAF modulated sigma54 specific transcriptional regulator [Clostridium fallax]
MKNRELIIEESHKRSKYYGIEKESSHSKKILKGESLEKILIKNKELIEISRTYIDMVYSALGDKDFIIVLTDNNGCILYVKGDNKIVDEFEKLDLIVGAYMDEKSIGTNAMGTAISEDKAVQITAKEHYIDIFHKLTCSAAPIHNSSGKIIGTLNLTGEQSKKHPHTLGLVIFGVKAIENELDKLKINNILDETYNYMESVIDNVDKGIMIVDTKGKIKNISTFGAEILFEVKEQIINKNIEDIVPDWINILEELENGKEYFAKEVKIKHTSKHKVLLKFRAVRLKTKVVGMVITMTCEKEIPLNNTLNTGAFYNFDDIIGESAAIANVITNCKIISNSPSTVLIEGESGTGKEVLAQAMHNYSHRRNNKFVAINCGAIPENIIESELFGYDEGTFTGGRKGGKEGKFELANGGTLFLDEIGEMSLDLQVNLLRILQEGRVTRLGGNKEIPVDVRVIAATNRDLRKEIKKGNFREDLYYRLCVIPIKVPPLRERKGDIKKLISYFLRIKAFKLNKSVPHINESLYYKLINYNWPGNIRQLENCIENLVNLEGNISFDIFNDIEENNIYYENKFNSLDFNNEKDEIEFLDTFNLVDIEKATIIKAIRGCKNNMSKAATFLGISRNTLYNKIKKYKIKL